MAVRTVEVDGVKAKLDDAVLDDFDFAEAYLGWNVSNSVQDFADSAKALLGDQYGEVKDALRKRDGRLRTSAFCVWVNKAVAELASKN